MSWWPNVRNKSVSNFAAFLKLCHRETNLPYRIKNWRKFQHYKHRDPPWIKLHRSIIDDREWHLLSGDAAKNLVMLWLIASERDGELPSISDLAFRLRTTEENTNLIVSALSHWVEHNASTLLADGLHDAVPEESRGRDRVETELEREGDASTSLAANSLISKEAFEISEDVLKALNEDREDPKWSGFPYIVQIWVAQKIPRDFIISTCANFPGKHRNYLDKAVQNGWRDKQSDQQTPRKINGPSTGNIMPAIDKLIERVRDLDRPPAIGGGAGKDTVRLLSEGGCERPGSLHDGDHGDLGGIPAGSDPARH